MRNKICLALAAGAVLLFALISSATGELSTNLQVRTELNRDNKKTESVTFIDADGNPVIADDKGYATIHYTYVTGNKVGTTSFLDTEGNLINCVDGYAQKTVLYSDGKPSITEYLDAEGNPVTGPEGYSKQEIKYWYGKHSTTWEYDPDGNPVNLHRITEFVGGKYQALVKSDSWYDADNNPAAGPYGYAKVEYEHNGTTVIRTTYYDADGELYYYDKAGFAVKEHLYQYSRLSEIRYYGADGELCAGPEGYARAECSYPDWNSYNQRMMFFNADGTPYFTEKGYCGIQRKTRTNGTVTIESYFIGEDQRGYSSDGYSRVTYAHTQEGMVSAQKFYDDQDNLMVVESAGYAVVRYRYSKTTMKWTEYYGAEDEPILGPDGYFAVEYKYDGNQLTETVFYDTDKKTLINGLEGYARIVYERDGNGNIISEQWYDAEGNRFILRDNADEIRYEWSGGKKISESYWADGEPVAGEKGAHEILLEYTGTNKISAQSYLDSESRLILNTDGYARVERQYNSQGSTMMTLYYDADWNLINAPGKEYAYVRLISLMDKDYLGEWSDLNAEDPGLIPEAVESDEQETEETVQEEPETDVEEEPEAKTADMLYIEYFGTDRKLMNLSAGYAMVVQQLDENGRAVEESFLDADGEKAVLEGGYHSIKKSYGEDGFASSTAYFGLDGEPVINTKLKYHRIERTYLDKNHYTSEAWFDTEGQPITTGNTYVRIEREFDGNGNAVVTRTYGENGEKIARNEGYDEIRQTFNDQNKATRTEYYLNEEPATLSAGYAALEREYDEMGNAVVTRYYGADGEQVARKEGYDEIHQDYNDQNKASRIEYYLNGKPATLSAGYAALEREYDEEGNITVEKYFDENGGKTLVDGGYHSFIKVFGEDGFASSTAYFGLDGEPVINTKIKCHRIERTYLDKNHYTSEAWFDTDGQPMTTGNTYARIEREFDEYGNTTVMRYYGADGEKIARKEGYDEVHQIFNEQNRAARIEYWLDGEPVTLSGGYAALEREYDDQGNIVIERYYGADGNKAARKAGYDEIRQEFNEQNKPVRVTYFLNGEPAKNNKGVYQVEYEYNEKGEVIREMYFDANGEPAANSDGYYLIEKTYDSDGNLIGETGKELAKDDAN